MSENRSTNPSRVLRLPDAAFVRPGETVRRSREAVAASKETIERCRMRISDSMRIIDGGRAVPMKFGEVPQMETTADDERLFELYSRRDGAVEQREINREVRLTVERGAWL